MYMSNIKSTRRKCACVCILSALAAQGAFGELSVVDIGGRLSVLRDGATVVSAICVDRATDEEGDVCSTAIGTEDGARVWNRWSEVPDRRFRLEVAKRADGAVEITMAGTVDAESGCRRRVLELRLDEGAFRGRPFEAVRGATAVFRTETGVFDSDMKPGDWRWLAAAGLTFDLNPIGPGNVFGSAGTGLDGHVDGVYARGRLERSGAGWTIRMGEDVRSSYGGYVGAKVVIREGVFGDYDRYHLIRKYFYTKTPPAVHLLAFGSPLRGTAYAEGDVAYLPARGYGWAQDFSVGNSERKPAVGFREGAYYSALSGTFPDTYRFGNLADGYYLFSYAAGNYAGVSNRFSVSVGDVRLLSETTVPSGALRRITRAVHVAGGTLDVAFDGSWLVSAMALQPVIADGEDFSVGRGFWVTRGYEPGVIFRSSDWTPFTPGVADETQTLPVPGTEFSAAPRDPPVPVELPDPDAPELAWTKNARIYRLFNNSSTLAQLDDLGVREHFLDRELSGRNVNAVMISGTLTRHTQPAREEAMIKSVGRIVQSLHRRGIKAFDHIDATILWNSGLGFRIMMEKPDQLLRTWDNDLPSYHFCISNPDWRERFFGQLRKTVAEGVDALQIDELYHWYKGCTCRFCRDKFFRETGWQVPMNECDPAWADSLSPFRRRWRDWRIKDCTNWFVELRRRTKDINPHLVLSAYTYTGGLIFSGSGDIGQELLDLSRAVNFFGVEVMSRSVLRSARAELPLRRAQNIYNFAFGAPVWDWYYNFDAPTDYAAWAMSEMTCQSPMLSDVKPEPGYPNYVGFDESRGAMRRHGARPVADVALFFSSHTRDLNIDIPWQKSLFGIAQALESLHVPYVFVPDVNLEAKRLSAYRTLVLTGIERLTESDRKILSEYESAGGRIVRGVEGAEEFSQRSLRCNPYRVTPDVYDFDPGQSAESDFRRRVAAAVGESGECRIDAPDRVATSVWREESGALAVHILNLTGVANKVGEEIPRTAPNPAFPPIGRDVVITLQTSEASEAEAVSPDFEGARRLVVGKGPGGATTVVLPAALLKAYVLVRIR